MIALDPGMAFGTGLHPTTRLRLAALHGLATRGGLTGARVLDVGCGSGILGIGAMKLGAARVLGVDTDPIAVESTAANAERNGLGSQIRARHGSLPTAAGPFDVVLANLIADGARRAGATTSRRDPAGRGDRGVGGIFVDREPDVRQAFDEAGIDAGDVLREGDWVALTSTRR